MLSINNISMVHGNQIRLNVPSLEIAGNALTVILGHNGSGKSTLMKLMARQNHPQVGQLSIQGRPFQQYSSRAFAQRVAYLPQYLPLATGLTVYDLVSLGRFPHTGLLGRWRSEDREAVQQAIKDTNISNYASHLVDSLSGGERHRAWIAMMLAQESTMMLLDEPTASLDLRHQYELMQLLQKLTKSKQRGTVVVLHDINLAVRFADRIIALKNGVVAFDGTPEEMLNESLLSELYEIKFTLLSQEDCTQKLAVVAN